LAVITIRSIRDNRRARAFLILTAAVLIVIAAGVGVSAATQPSATYVTCESVRVCIQAARAAGISPALWTLGGTDLHFVSGWVTYPSVEGDIEDWGVTLQFAGPTRDGPFQWSVGPWPFPKAFSCSGSADWKTLATDGLSLCYFSQDDVYFEYGRLLYRLRRALDAAHRVDAHPYARRLAGWPSLGGVVRSTLWRAYCYRSPG
jgi:hypothetical protein